MFSGSIRENIAYGNNNITESDIIDASVKAQAHEFIVNLPNGYDTLVGERGVMLSGGQRQRIAIARAILKKPIILILDEATSSLDAHSELLVHKALQEVMQNCTTFLISHRISLIKNFNRIIVIDKGNINENGNHEDLINIENGIYRKLYEDQLAISDLSN